MSKSNNTNYGISFPTLLGLVFIVLKLCKVIDWSWWWVLSPFWTGLALVLLFLVVLIIVKLKSK